MILRYSRPEMAALWSEEARWNAALKVEAVRERLTSLGCAHCTARDGQHCTDYGA